jgi:virulence-associated protein VagC
MWYIVLLYMREKPGGGSTARRGRRASAAAGSGRAKVFWSGRSQAVRLPKAFRVATREVSVRREGETLVLEPVESARDENGWPLAFWALAGSAHAFDLGDRRTPHERGDPFER